MTAAVIDRADVDPLPAELAELIPDDAPELVAVSWVADHLGITQQAVNAAIKAGRIPSLTIHGSGGIVSARAVRPVDAARLWGNRVLKRRAATEKTANQP